MRKSTYMDREFGREDYEADDQGDFKANLVFVIMPFAGEDMDDVYSAIKDECLKLGLNSRRVDENTGSGVILREITELIEDAEFIICDLTKERPNVYYELGYAHGVGNEANEILLIAKDGTKPHFDVAPLRVHHYKSTEHLRKILSTNLAKMIKITREA